MSAIETEPRDVPGEPPKPPELAARPEPAATSNQRTRDKGAKDAMARAVAAMEAKAEAAAPKEAAKEGDQPAPAAG